MIRLLVYYIRTDGTYHHGMHNVCELRIEESVLEMPGPDVNHWLTQEVSVQTGHCCIIITGTLELK